VGGLAARRAPPPGRLPAGDPARHDRRTRRVAVVLVAADGEHGAPVSAASWPLSRVSQYHRPVRCPI